jgi:MoaA/NifB/PqqE/SkfB family radical SAM enzyme
MNTRHEPSVETGGCGQTDGLRMVYVEMAAACDMSCPMCVTLPHRDGHRKVMSRQEIRERVLQPCAARGMGRVIFGGGEPTLRKDYLDILGDAVECGFQIWLATNLGRMTDERLVALLERLRTGRHNIAVSFDSHVPAEMNATRGADVFEQVDRNCRRIVALRNQIGGDLTLTNTIIVQSVNRASVEATVDYVLDEIGFDTVQIHPRHDYRAVTLDNFLEQDRSDWCREHEAEFVALGMRLYHRMMRDPRLYLQGSLADWINFFRAPQRIARPCDAGRMLFVNPEGELRTCMFGTPYDSVVSGEIDAIVGSDAYQKVRQFQNSCRICHLSCN